MMVSAQSAGGGGRGCWRGLVSAGGEWECWKGLGVWEWPGSAGGARWAEFAGDLCTSTLIYIIKEKTFSPPLVQCLVWGKFSSCLLGSSISLLCTQPHAINAILIPLTWCS